MKVRAVYSENLYVDDGIEIKKLDKLKSKLNKKPLFCNQYLVVLSNNATDQLEIFQGKQLIWNYYLKNPVRVVGIFEDSAGAIEWIGNITNQCYKTKGNCNLKEYLGCTFS